MSIITHDLTGDLALKCSPREDYSQDPALYRETQILGNRKSVSLWQARISKIDESYFWNKILHEKVRDITQNGRKWTQIQRSTILGKQEHHNDQ